jgi:phytoene/squalene synthetase
VVARRLSTGTPAHPVTRYLAQWVANPSQIAPLQTSIDAADAQIAGVPLERTADLPSHADAMYGAPLRVAAGLAGVSLSGAVHACTAALAVGDYLARALADYGRECRAGRMPFPVDELLAAGIDNDDLAAGRPPPRLETYLQTLRRGAALQFRTADAALAGPEGSSLRHLSVLACLGARHVEGSISPSSSDFRWRDFYHAWKAAQHAAAAR